MKSVCILGDSLSVPGYGIVDATQTWPFVFRGCWTGDISVSVHGKGGLTLAYGGPGDGNFFGHQACFGTALNAEADAYVICLGTNDAIRNRDASDIERGVTRLIRHLRGGVKSAAGKSIRVYVLAPPSIHHHPAAESRRRDVVLSVLDNVCCKEGATVLGEPMLDECDKHADGVHLNSSGARSFGRHVAKELLASGRQRRVLKLNVVPMTRRQVSRASAAARKLGKEAFLRMPRADLRKWASQHGVPFSGARLKSEEVKNIISKLDVRWSLPF